MTDADQHAKPPTPDVTSGAVTLGLAAYDLRQVIRPAWLAAFVAFCAFFGLIFFLSTPGTTGHRVWTGILFFVLAFFAFGLMFLSYRLLYWIVSLFAGIAVEAGKDEVMALAEKHRKESSLDPEVASFYDGHPDGSHAAAPTTAKGSAQTPQ
jgi:hypothetical protein